MRQYDTMHLHNDIQQEPCSQISVRAFMFPAVIMVTVSPVFFSCSSATSLLSFFFNLYITQCRHSHLLLYDTARISLLYFSLLQSPGKALRNILYNIIRPYISS